jgi:Tfp pilus assembly protein PilZ
MASANPPSESNTINFKLAEVIKNLPEKQQLILIKQLLEDNLTPTLFSLIGKMTDDQQAALLENLQNHPLQTMNLEETEIALRDHTRKSCMLSVDYRVDNRNFEGFMLDISPAGAFIETGEPFTAGQRIGITFSLPNSPGQLQLTGEILWKGMLGIGVRFKNLNHDQSEQISTFMAEEEV